MCIYVYAYVCARVCYSKARSRHATARAGVGTKQTQNTPDAEKRFAVNEAELVRV